MQKVEGSSPFSRFAEKPRKRGVFCWPDAGVSGACGRFRGLECPFSVRTPPAGPRRQAHERLSEVAAEEVFQFCWRSAHTSLGPSSSAVTRGTIHRFIDVAIAIVAAAAMLASAGCVDDDHGPADRHAPAPERPSTPSPGGSGSDGLPVPQSYADTCGVEPQVCTWDGPGGVPTKLQRAFRNPLARGAEDCPTSRGRAFRNSIFSGTAIGRGPVRPIVAAGQARLLRAGIVQFERGADGWWGAKTLWFAPRTYQGPVLLRGRRIDRPGPLAFGEQPAALARQIPPGPDHSVNVHDRVRHWPGSTWIQRAGCYAWQVDGEGFSTTIVFRGELKSAEGS
jgi:hypothetical protein